MYWASARQRLFVLGALEGKAYAATLTLDSPIHDIRLQHWCYACEHRDASQALEGAMRSTHQCTSQFSYDGMCRRAVKVSIRPGAGYVEKSVLIDRASLVQHA